MALNNRFRNDLDQEVALATGEDLRTIRRRSFSLIDLTNHDFDPEPDLRAPQVIDRDQLDQDRAVTYLSENHLRRVA